MPMPCPGGGKSLSAFQAKKQYLKQLQPYTTCLLHCIALCFKVDKVSYQTNTLKKATIYQAPKKLFITKLNTYHQIKYMLTDQGFN